MESNIVNPLVFLASTVGMTMLSLVVILGVVALIDKILGR